MNIAPISSLSADTGVAFAEDAPADFTATGENDEQNYEAANAEVQRLQEKASELERSNYRLRVENLTLRTRLDRLKSSRSFERKLLLALGLALWLFFLLSVRLLGLHFG